MFRLTSFVILSPKTYGGNKNEEKNDVQLKKVFDKYNLYEKLM